MKASVTIEGKNIKLRPMTQADVEPFWKMINEPSVRKWWGNETRQDMQDLLTDKDVEVWAIEKAGQVVGMIQSYEELTADYKHAGMDISLVSEAQGRGYGGEALRLVAKYLFGKGHHRIVIDPDFDNEHAVKAYAKVGFKPVGIMRQYSRNVGKQGWHDGLLMDMLKDELTEA